MAGYKGALRRRAWDGALTTTLGVALVAVPVLAQGTWLDALRRQLAEDRGCVLDQVTQVRELKLGDNVALEGRIRCHDGREFDFTRDQPHLAFKLQLCLPTYC